MAGREQGEQGEGKEQGEGEEERNI